jgi:hypothetical protein
MYNLMVSAVFGESMSDAVPTIFELQSAVENETVPVGAFCALWNMVGPAVAQGEYLPVENCMARAYTLYSAPSVHF